MRSWTSAHRSFEHGLPPWLMVLFQLLQVEPERWSPVTASIRRTPEATPLSAITLNKPMSPVLPHMGAPAQLTAAANVEHTHGFTIFFAKQHHGTGLAAPTRCPSRAH
jgi:hypothetical protein